MSDNKFLATPGSRIAAVVGIAFAAPLALVLGITQITSMAVQRKAESEAVHSIASMKSEQAWLVGQGLVKARPIGVFNSSLFSSNFRSRETSGAHASPVRLVAGVEPSLLVEGAAKALGAGRPEWILSASRDGAPSFGEAAVDSEYARRAVYRHEEGHARMFERLQPVGPLRSTHPAAAKVLSGLLNAAHADTSQGNAPSANDWRSSWLATLRSEAYADAYSAISVARKSPSSMREAAMHFHASRIFPSSARHETALDHAGDPHSVDMASFMSAQLDPKSVALLDAKGLDSLAGSIADASVEWAIARQASSLGFFSGQGSSWWAGKAQAAGLSPAESQASWEALRETSLAATPGAVFNPKILSAGGQSFIVQGLPKPLALAAWRFDGRGGQSFSSTRHVDPATQKSIQGAALANPTAASDAGLDAYRGAVSTHAALAKLAGASLEREADRLSLTAKGTRSVSGDYKAFMASAIHDLSPRLASIDAPPSVDIPRKIFARRAAAISALPGAAAGRSLGLPKPSGL